jgi:hypothetical protein
MICWRIQVRPLTLPSIFLLSLYVCILLSCPRRQMLMNSSNGFRLFGCVYTVLSDDLIQEAIPGNIRKAEHFVAFMKRFVEYLKVRLTPSSTILSSSHSTFSRLAG